MYPISTSLNKNGSSQSKQKAGDSTLSKPPVPLFTQVNKKNPTALYEGMVSNLKDVRFVLPPTKSGYVADENSENPIKKILDFDPFTVEPRRPQFLDPQEFFGQFSLYPPSSCSTESLKGFYELIKSHQLTNKLPIREFLAFDVFLTLKKSKLMKSPLLN